MNVLDAGPAEVRESGEPMRDGYHIMFEVPIFDWGDAKVAKAELFYQQAEQRFRETAVNARSEVRLARSSRMISATLVASDGTAPVRG